MTIWQRTKDMGQVDSKLASNNSNNNKVGNAFCGLRVFIYLIIMYSTSLQYYTGLSLVCATKMAKLVGHTHVCLQWEFAFVLVPSFRKIGIKTFYVVLAISGQPFQVTMVESLIFYLYAGIRTSYT